MRRSAHVVAPLLASAAVALLAGCRPEMQRCVDEYGHVVDASNCSTLSPGSSLMTRGPHPGVHIYRYYYGGRGSYSAGSSVSGGSYYPIGGHSYSDATGHSVMSSSGTARGGFGRSFSSGGHGSSGGE